MLTPRQSIVLYHIAAGLSNREIAERLGISPATVSRHQDRIYRKLGAVNRVQAAVRFLYNVSADYGAVVETDPARMRRGWRVEVGTSPVESVAGTVREITAMELYYRSADPAADVFEWEASDE